MLSPITLVLTSCGRFDLLAGTLESFLAHNRHPLARMLVIEDSGDAAVRDVVRSINPAIDVLVNERRLGQLASIDRAYGMVATPWIFHCEDDWRFIGGGFIEDSLVLLRRHRKVTVVLCRRLGQNPVHDAMHVRALPKVTDGIGWRRVLPDGKAPWGGYSFNPGLRRRSDWQRIGGFARFGHETRLSHFMLRHGRGLAMLDRVACETIGGERRIADPTAATPLTPREIARQRRRVSP